MPLTPFRDLPSLRDAVLEFWFQGQPEVFNPAWFTKDPAFDAAIAGRFGAAVDQAAAGAADGLMADPHGALALCILLDQFPRNLYRGTARAFASDAKALSVARQAVADGFDRIFPVAQRMFFYLPYEHSEDPAIQRASLRLFASLNNDDLLDYARRHADIIARFGRYPHRNAALGRPSTAEEEAFLREPGSSF
ncbi:DUF924 family protein [Novispirillum itersonii]|uniref:Uncharacterized protein (DUF924 family) n=1 Tax=Novispirillum itersonii TaxID=189 RepID=A0A7W9ZCC4_NOVIT|nr:DUF924 family protein [Novispirillum itersonii]MBB6208868.1 uncharacterized protein (DUF924 family) [Novispirillum itersonii]